MRPAQMLCTAEFTFDCRLDKQATCDVKHAANKQQANKTNPNIFCCNFFCRLTFYECRNTLKDLGGGGADSKKMPPPRRRETSISSLRFTTLAVTAFCESHSHQQYHKFPHMRWCHLSTPFFDLSREPGGLISGFLQPNNTARQSLRYKLHVHKMSSQ